MFPVEKELINNAIARKILSPTETDFQNLNLGNLLDESQINKIFTKAWNSAWKTFTMFGELLLGFWMICKVQNRDIETPVSKNLHT